MMNIDNVRLYHSFWQSIENNYIIKTGQTKCSQKLLKKTGHKTLPLPLNVVRHGTQTSTSIYYVILKYTIS